MSHRRPWLLALAAALAAFVTSNALESAVIGTTGGSPWTLAYLSDAILAALMMVATYLWLHVRNLRGQLTSMERKSIATDTELELAARIQRAALDAVVSRMPGLLWHAETVPAGHVGGDFYDIVALDDDTALLVVADVSGKGVPAALGLASARAAFRMLVQTISDPTEIAERWSRWLYADTGGAPYLTALLMLLDRKRRRLRYVNAGHPAGLLMSAQGEHRLRTTCQPLGLMPGVRAISEELDFPSDALGLIVTDGVSEALEDADDPADQLAALARPLQALSPRQVVDQLLTAARGSGEKRVAPADDQTVMAFKVED
jgi:sigma-B regulation protein RsbU (phosphoserine phosphatase)